MSVSKCDRWLWIWHRWQLGTFGLLIAASTIYLLMR